VETDVPPQSPRLAKRQHVSNSINKIFGIKSKRKKHGNYIIEISVIVGFISALGFCSQLYKKTDFMMFQET
jgi:hypothetical protein